MAGRQGATDIAPLVRGSFGRGLKINQEMLTKDKHGPYAGMSLSDIFARMIAEGNVTEVINAVSKFTPKELLIDVEGQISFDTAALTPIQLQEVFSGTTIEGTASEVQGGNTLAATAGSADDGISLPGGRDPVRRGRRGRQDGIGGGPMPDPASGDIVRQEGSQAAPGGAGLPW